MAHEQDETGQNEDQEVYQRGSMDVYAVRLTAWHARMARRLGHGNLSRGIRLALEKILKPADPPA